ncbi:MAG TPA: FmdB family zinc ribbon protein [Dehalococcoidia bacterium]|nr:FmdB family zinc ribbon protein [Dehalococcoidia bacterium]
MPTYDYRCNKGHRYERRESFGSSTTHDCEKCGVEATRVLNAPAISFKGSGWYKTDSRGNEPRTSKADKTKADSSKNSGSGESGTSSKSDSSSNGSSGDSSSKGEKAKISKAD